MSHNFSDVECIVRTKFSRKPVSVRKDICNDVYAYMDHLENFDYEKHLDNNVFQVFLSSIEHFQNSSRHEYFLAQVLHILKIIDDVAIDVAKIFTYTSKKISCRKLAATAFHVQAYIKYTGEKRRCFQICLQSKPQQIQEIYGVSNMPRFPCYCGWEWAKEYIDKTPTLWGNETSLHLLFYSFDSPQTFFEEPETNCTSQQKRIQRYSLVNELLDQLMPQNQ